MNLITINKGDKRTVLKKAHLLGPNLSITDWPANSRGAYHISEFSAFEKAVAIVFIHQEDLPAAKERLRRLLELGTPEEDLSPLLDLYQFTSIELAGKRRESVRTRQVKPVSHCTLDYREDYLTLEVGEGPLDDLWYSHVDNVEAPLLERMLALPRETIIESARRVLYVTLTVFQAAETKDVYEDDIDTFAQMGQHALFLLAILGADEVLPQVLDFARLGENGCDLMFGDYVEELFMVVLVELGRKDPEPLKDYLYEPHHESFTRLHVMMALEQIAWHEPELREQIVGYFKAWLNTLLADQGNHPVLDTLVVTHVVWALVKLRADHLLPLLRKVSDRGWIEEDYAGDIEQFAEEITRSPDPAHRMPLPKTPEEYYTMIYRERRAKSAFPLLAEPDEFDELLLSRMTRGISELLGNHLPAVPPMEIGETSTAKIVPVRTGQKVGRNDPCPCGSGRKYKKCCL